MTRSTAAKITERALRRQKSTKPTSRTGNVIRIRGGVACAGRWATVSAYIGRSACRGNRSRIGCGQEIVSPQPTRLLQNASRQFGGLLPQTDQQLGAAAISEQGAHFGALRGYAADRTLGQHIDHSPPAALLAHDVVQRVH